MKNNKLATWIPSTVGVLGIFIALVSVLFDLIGLGEPPIGPKQLLGVAVGLIIVVGSYWLHRWLGGDLAKRDIPQVLITVIVFVGWPIMLLHMFNTDMRLGTGLRVLENLEQRFGIVDIIAHSPARHVEACLPASRGSMPAMKLEPVVRGLTKPVYVTHANDGSGRLFVVEKPGTIRIVKDGVLLPEPFLDIRDRAISDESNPSASWEQGLLSVAFHPDYAANGRLFVNYTAVEDGRTIVAEYHATNNPNAADRDSERVILEIPQRGKDHNGGQLQFGPDGFLYIGTGDGGLLADPGNNGQNMQVLLGKMLRIDVNGDLPYGIPADNPFVHRQGVRPEIFASGFRNPWRFSFDRCDGTLFTGDVGAGQWEEVDLVVKGGNYGWSTMEGAHCFPPESACDRGGLQLPIVEYGHSRFDSRGGNAIIGGYVYRGRRFPELTGQYFFADFLSTRLWMLTESRASVNRWQRKEVLKTNTLISSFGEGEGGELYLVGYEGSLYVLTVAR